MKMEQMMNGGGFGGGDGGTNFFLGKFESSPTTTNTITCNDIATARPSTPSTQSSRISMINCFDDYRLLQDNLFSVPRQKNPNYQIINNHNHNGEGDFKMAVVKDSLPPPTASRSPINHQDAELNDFWTKFTLAAGTKEQEQEDDNDFDYENILRDETIPIPSQQQQQQQIYQQQQNNDHNFNYQPPVAQQQQAYHENSFLSRSCPPPDTLTLSSSSWSSVQQPFESRPLINVDVDSVVGPRPTTTTTTTSTFEHQDHHLSSSSPLPPTSSSQQFHQCQWFECNGMFATIMELVEHVESGHIEHQRRLQQTTMQILNHYVCQWKDCQRSMKPFDQRYKLRNHLRQHTKEKPKKCEFEGCNRSFSRQENLRIHMRSHTNERPYLCPICPKAFRNSSDKAKHRRTHDNPRPCVCNYLNCNKRYTDPSSLRKHKKNHHPEELCKQDYNGLSRSWSAEPTTVTATTANHNDDHHGTSWNQNLGHTWSNYVFNQFNSSTNQLPDDNFWDTNQNNNNDNQWIMDNGFMAEQSTMMMMNKSATTTTGDHGFGEHHQYHPDPESAQAFNMDYSNNSSLSTSGGVNGGSDDDEEDEDDDYVNLTDFLSDQIGNNLSVGP